MALSKETHWHGSWQEVVAKYASEGVLCTVKSVWEIANHFIVMTNEDCIPLRNIETTQAGLLHAIKPQLTKIQEAKANTKDSPALTSLQEFQSQIAYAAEVAQALSDYETTDTDTDTSSDYDARELNEWARKTSDLTTGLRYSLYTFHRLITGSGISGKPLMEFIFPLLEQDPAIGPRAGWFYGYLIAMQAQGFAILLKARTHLGLKKISIERDFTKRIEEQIPVVMKSLQASKLDWSGWNNDFNYVSDFGRKLPKTGSAIYLMVTGVNRVVCGVEVDEYEKKLILRCGRVVSNLGVSEVVDITTEQVEYGNQQDVSAAWGLRTGPLADGSGRAGFTLQFNGLPIVVGPEYAIVGIVYGNDPYAGWLCPIVSKWDPVTCQHQWDGEHGRIFQARPGGEDLTFYTMKAGASPRLCTAQRIGRTEGMLRGVGLRADADGNARVACLSDGVSADTWLPLGFEASSGIQYDKVVLPKHTRRVEALHYLGA